MDNFQDFFYTSRKFSIAKDIYNADNIKEGGTHKFVTAAEKTQIATNATNISTLQNNALQWASDTTGFDAGRNITVDGVTTKTAQKISNVANGALSTASTDAVNGRQLFATNANIATNATNIATNTANIATNNDTILRLQNSFVGQVAFFPFTSAPSGWVKANGALLSRTTYANLYEVAKAYGIFVTEDEWKSSGWGYFTFGDGETTFRIPDLRGEFLRAWDDGRGVDNGRVFGSWQVDMFKSHSHGLRIQPLGGTISSWYVDGGARGTGPQNTEPTGGDETRPRNIALLACIRY